MLTVTTLQKKGALIMPNIDIENYLEQDRWDFSNECNEWEETMANPNRIECSRIMSVMTELKIMKWQIYFSHLTIRTHWTIHVMTERRTIVRERIDRNCDVLPLLYFD